MNRQAFLFTKLMKSLISFDAKSGLQTISCVIKPRMQDATVASAGMAGYFCFFLKDCNLEARGPGKKCSGDSQSQDSGTNNQVVIRPFVTVGKIHTLLYHNLVIFARAKSLTRD